LLSLDFIVAGNSGFQIPDFRSQTNRQYNQQSTIGNQHSAIDSRQSAISIRQSAIDNQQISNRQSQIALPDLVRNVFAGAPG
jgi:hypothetical protein